MNETDLRLLAGPQADVGEAESVGLSSHLVPLVEGEWAAWRWVALRGAGFPAEQVLSLASASCSAAADQLLEAERKVKQAEENAAAAINAALNALRRADQWHDAAQRDPLSKSSRSMLTLTARCTLISLPS